MTLDVFIVRDYAHMSDVAASILMPQIRAVTVERQEFFNLGLAAGHSPTKLYEHLVSRQEEFIAGKIRCSNIDEYVGLPGNTPAERAIHTNSYNSEIHQELLNRLNPPFLKNMLPGWEIDVFLLEKALEESSRGVQLVGNDSGKCVDISSSRHPYLRSIQEGILEGYPKSLLTAGSIDWQILGSGRHGHIALHERGIPLNYIMMLVQLDEQTRTDAVEEGYFTSEEMPKYALTLGAMGIVLLSRNVLFLGSGEKRTEPVTRSLLDGISSYTPLSALQHYIECPADIKKAIYVVDEVAAAEILKHERQLAQKGIATKDLRNQTISSAISPILQ